MKKKALILIMLLASTFFGMEVMYNIYPGWNLLAVPCGHRGEPIERYFPVETPAYIYDPETHIYAETDTIPEGHIAFWAYATETGIAILNQDSLPHERSIQLRRGFNMISMPCNISGEPIEDYFQYIHPAYIYDTESSLYREIDTIPVASKPFWILCINDTVIDFPCEYEDIVWRNDIATNISIAVLARTMSGISCIGSSILSIEKDTLIHEDTPPYGDSRRWVRASAEGYYTQYWHSRDSIVYSIDLDTVPTFPNLICGTIRGKDHEGSTYDFWPYAEREIYLVNREYPGETVSIAITDAQGRYIFNVPEIFDSARVEYEIHVPFPDFEEEFGFDTTYVYELEYSGTNLYYDYTFTVPTFTLAPILYLYPPETTLVEVTIDLDSLERMFVSEPPYEDGWEFTIAPDGMIEDGEYEYLFYETVSERVYQFETGWVLDGAILETELREMLANHGFIGREIDDFVDYWIPKLGDYEYYEVYPQDESHMSRLSTEPAYDTAIRWLFYIIPRNYEPTIAEYELPESFSREGFSVAEWGVAGWSPHY